MLNAELGQNFQNFGVVFGVLRIGNIRDVKYQRGFLYLFERGAKCRDKIRGQISKKSNGIRKQNAAARRQPDSSYRGVECGEHLRGCEDVGGSERVKERRFAGVGVAD